MTFFNPREEIKQELEKILPGSFSNLENIEDFGQEKACHVLKVLIENSCLATNVGVITAGRELTKRVPKSFLIKNIESQIESSLDLSDEWDYRRLLELLDIVLPELTNKYVQIGLKMDGDIKEAAEDWFYG